MDYILLLTLGLFLAAALRFKAGNYFAPWTLTAGVWFTIILLIQFEYDMLEPLSEQFYTCLCIWLPVFIASSLITYNVMPRVSNPKAASLSEMNMSSIIFNSLYVLSMVLTPLYLWQILKIVTMFDLSDLLFNIRLMAVYGEQELGILRYASVINQALFIVAIWRYPKVPLWQLLTILLANLMCSFAIMEKGSVFLLFITVLFVLYEKGSIKLRTIAVTAVVIVLLFYLITVARGEQSNSTNEEMSFIEFFTIYILSPSVAFGRLSEDLTLQVGPNTFSTIYLFLERFGFDVEVHTKLQEFVWVPVPTNVYTIFQPFYQDFGYSGVGFFGLIYGTLSGWVYRLYRNGNDTARCIYSYIIYALTLQFFQENIILSLVFFVQLCFFLYIIVQNKFNLNFALPQSISKKCN